MKLKSKPYLTVLTIVFGLLFFNFFLENKILFLVALIISGLGILSPRISFFIENIWFKFSFLLSQLIPNILLSSIFFFLLTPLALLSKVFKSNTNFIYSNRSTTTFKIVNKKFDEKSFERAW